MISVIGLLKRRYSAICIVLLAPIAFALFTPSETFSSDAAYENHSLLRLPELSEEQLEQFWGYGFDVIRHPSTEQIEVVATKRDKDILIDQFGAVVVIENMEENYRAGLQTAEAALMGGYRTYSEICAYFDSVALARPDVCHLDTIGYSLEGRAILALKLSDNVEIDEDEPEVQLNGLTHAREPITYEMLILFLEYLLINPYDVTAKAIIENNETWFIPVINPDGLVYNELTNPEGGGMWRKNRRDNLDGSFGVDLNRNFGFEWGYNDQGSSANGSSEVYRGAAPFSEPESQVVREFFNSRDFCLSIHHHAFGDFMNIPYNFFQQFFVIDELTEVSSAEMMAAIGGLNLADDYMGYGPNGTSYDWSYGEQFEKRKCFSWLVELGPDFWPPSAQIDDIFERYLPALKYVVSNAGQFWHTPSRSVATDYTEHFTTDHPCAPDYSELVSFHNVDPDRQLQFQLSFAHPSPYQDWFEMTPVDTLLNPGDSIVVELRYHPGANAAVPLGTGILAYLDMVVTDPIGGEADTLVWSIVTIVDLTDADGDGIDDACDNCTMVANANQTDSDLDGIGDSCDNCIAVSNFEQADSDFDNVGDSCDLCVGYDDLADFDLDGVADSCDNCPPLPNPLQEDLDQNGIGDVCESCCQNGTGNVDGDPQDITDIGDLTALIGYLFIPPFEEPECMAEANADGDPGHVVDIGDLTALIGYLFIPPFDPPAACM